MSSSTRTSPKTIRELQGALRLGKADAEALVKSEAVREAFRQYMNRCLSSGSATKKLPDWKEVDDYLHDKRISTRVRRGVKSVEAAVADDCFEQPYELLPHASLFALRVMKFLKSSKGKAYDVDPDESAVMRWQEVEFDLCVRVMNLLAFLVNWNRQMRSWV
ncbi:hypothetical protein AAE478_006173 [Parahypoxylon ruwenzoriense]